MQPYNSYFPTGYQPINPYQQYQSYQQNFQQPVQQNAGQPLTAPTIHAEIIQVDNEQAALNYPVAAGCSQMMIAKDDSEIYVKTAYANGQSQTEVYEKRIVQPVQESNGLENYVTIDMLNGRLQEIIAAFNNEIRNSQSQQISREGVTKNERNVSEA